MRQVDSHSALTAMSQILRVDVTELTGDEPSDLPASQYSAAQDIERAMMAYDALESLIGAQTAEFAPDLTRLGLGIERVHCAYQAARYDEAGRMLPGLIRDVEVTARTCRRRDTTAVGALRAQVYQATTMVLSRVGETGLAWTAAGRAVTAAEHADAGLLAAVSAFRLAHVFIRRKHTPQARDLTASAANALQRSGPNGDPERLSVLGGLHLAHALAAASDLDRAATGQSLAAATRLADRLGEDRNDHWTAFGPTNVRIHHVSAAIAFGDASAAVETGETIDIQRLPTALAGRRSQVSLDLARAYAQQRHDAAAVNMLLAAERTAPQLIRYDAATHGLLDLMLRREHRASTPQLRPLARRAGLI
jgi:hypothetical protein